MVIFKVCTSSLLADGGLVSCNVNGHNSLVLVLDTQIQDVFGPMKKSIYAAQNQSGLESKYIFNLCMQSLEPQNFLFSKISIFERPDYLYILPFSALSLVPNLAQLVYASFSYNKTGPKQTPNKTILPLTLWCYSITLIRYNTTVVWITLINPE